MSELIALDDLLGRNVDLRLDNGRWCYGLVTGIYPKDKMHIELHLASDEFIPAYALQRTDGLVAHLKLEELPVRIRKEPPTVYLHRNVLRIIEWDKEPSMAKQKAGEQYGRFQEEHPEFVVLYHRSMPLNLQEGRYGYLVHAQLQRKPMPNDRETHFAGFAKAVERKLYEEHLLDLLHRETVFDASDAVIQILAQSAYDLVMRALTILDRPEYIDDVPDLTELPKEGEE
jgi:hypothetical protein